MKLLKAFQQQLANFTELKRVWLTSFNINIEFIEKYILPAVLNMEVPKTRMDYESLQIELAKSGIDFKVFCDKRFMGLERNKRTAIPIYGVSPERLGFSKESIFHAKVIYLEGNKHEPRILGSGSANLTLSGWARNQEVFHFEKVNSTELQSSFIQFFSRLFKALDINEKIVKRRGLNDNSNIRFSHSFQDTPFLRQLEAEENVTELSVWSPYFPHDLAAFVDRLKLYFDADDFRLNIVPDRTEGQYLRTQWSESIARKITQQEIRFFNSPVSADERSALCHAKVWKTKTHLAIGSWNFTNTGSNIPQSEDASFRATSNIEAGFILKDMHSTSSVLGEEFNASKKDFATPEQMEEEALYVPEDLPFELRVVFNWSDATYRFYGEWNDGKVDNKSYSVKLPGIAKSVPLHWKSRIKVLQLKPIVVRRTETLLVERQFEVMKDEEIISNGLILEEEPQYRRPQHYEGLRDLFDAMILGADDDSGAPMCVDEDESGRTLLSGRFLNDDTSEPINDEHDEDISFFRLFSASYQFAAKLKKAKDLKSLEHWVFVRPGCLEELINKTTDKIQRSHNSTIFSWFLAKEVTYLVNLAKRRRRFLNSNESNFPLSRWNSLEITMPEIPDEANSAYQGLIDKEYARMGRSWGNDEE